MVGRVTARRIVGGLALILAAGGAEAASPRAVEAAHGMVVSSQRLASEVGVEILKAGGNAVDAAVAVGYAEAVVNPCCGNIGGGGFMVLRLANGREIFINFRETAPAAATRTMYLDAAGNPVKGASLIGYRAAGVPGTVMGLDTALAKYGRLPRARVMAPAIRLARDGFVLTRGDTDILELGTDLFRADPTLAAIFLHKDGTALQPGDRLVQKDLAATLDAIAKAGPDAFYKGRIPRAIEAASKAGGGILTAADFAAYKATEAAPLSCSYRGYRFVSAPPPSSGGVTMCETLNILEGYDLKAMGYHSAAAVHVVTEALRHAYLDRNTYLGDPAFVANPLDRLLSKDYAATIRSEIPADRAVASASLASGAPPEKAETTHYSVIDRAGNAASVTYTVNGLFGAVVMAPHTGFFLNDEMDDFTTAPGRPNLSGLVQGAANAIEPGKRPLSSMAPTIVTKDGKLFLVLGSPGASRIITITLEAALNVIDYGMAPQEAVDAPRFHHQWLPDEIELEPRALSPDTERLLTGMGYRLVTQTPWGAVEMIAIGPDQPADAGLASSGHDAAVGGQMRPGLRYGAHDDRRPAGAAVGY
ncbi:gamma-glutamyltranspeptidase [Aliidongia dinghuensis]|uniref:Glutathione hydrolase proenzyme n=1 Tax=Aliidongia dinghuensis TaxID=1867774 RepID=A0A8J2YQB4_9PROT|nr:gamma-glutamyltransferase [Aliidongia dinghuensis]GGF03163.1 gamma-glutamyltranspeptidase [Aliidongia dinghuensis]